MRPLCTKKKWNHPSADVSSSNRKNKNHDRLSKHIPRPMSQWLATKKFISCKKDRNGCSPDNTILPFVVLVKQ